MALAVPMRQENLRSLSKMQNSFFLFLLPIFLFCETLEVALPTKAKICPVYLTKLHVPDSEYDWRYFEELREVFEFDLNAGGFASVARLKDVLDETLSWPDVRSFFNVAPWKKEQIAYVLAVQVYQNKFQLIVFDIAKGTSKKYQDFLLVGKLEKDRSQIHHLADQVQKDLFGVPGIASLKLLFSKRSKAGDDWNSEIWISDSDGANARPLVRDKGYCVTPGIFPSSAPLSGAYFYVSFQEGLSKIYRSSLQNPISEPMFTLRGSQILPAINKSGTQMAFISDIAGRPDLFVQNLDNRGHPIGKARQLFTSPNATQASPTYSPDGKQIAFVSDKDGPPRIYLIDVLGSKDTKRQVPKLITKINRENTCPAWSFDGTKLAFSAKVDKVRQIWIYDFATQQEYPVTTGPENKENPSWAPDNMHLVYNTESSDNCELYRIHIDRKEPVLISKCADQKRFPCWVYSAKSQAE